MLVEAVTRLTEEQKDVALLGRGEHGGEDTTAVAMFTGDHAGGRPARACGYQGLRHQCCRSPAPD